MDEEIWKDIKGYPKYEVSNLGRVRNKRGRVIRCRLRDDGYVDVGLSCRSVSRHHLMHRLVADAFLDGQKVSHKDGNHSNNRLDNLMVVDYVISKGTPNVVQKTLDGKFVAEYETIRAAARAVGGDAANISGALSGKYKTSHGYLWEWKNPLARREKKDGVRFREDEAKGEPCDITFENWVTGMRVSFTSTGDIEYFFKLDANEVKELLEGGHKLNVTWRVV